MIFVAPTGPQRQTTSPLGLHHPTAPAALNVAFGDIQVCAPTLSTSVSTTPTPLLTTEQNSPQSSGMPSTTPSLRGEVVGFGEEGEKREETPTPEVRIESV